MLHYSFPKFDDNFYDGTHFKSNALVTAGVLINPSYFCECIKNSCRHDTDFPGSCVYSKDKEIEATSRRSTEAYALEAIIPKVQE
jgi:hypothetical protein